MKKKHSLTLKISVCGVLAAFSYCMLALGALVEIFDFSSVIIASFAIVFCAAEMGTSFALMTYAVTSLLAFLLLPGSRFTALVYLLFGGLYPILRPYIDKCKKPFSIFLKFIYCNTAFILVWEITVLFLPENEEAGTLLFIAFFFLVHFAFWLYDTLISRLTVMYFAKWRKQLNIKGFDK